MPLISDEKLNQLNEHDLMILVDALANPVLKALVEQEIVDISARLISLDTNDAPQLYFDYRMFRVLLDEWETWKETTNRLIDSFQKTGQARERGELDLTQN